MENLDKRIADAAQRTWQAIGGDILRAAEEESLTREEVIECVADCDYLERYGGDAEAVSAFRSRGYEEQKAMLLKAFPLAEYGF